MATVKNLKFLNQRVNGMATVFETIVQPLLPLLKEEANSLKDDAQIYKLSLYYFTLSLVYAVIKQIQSIRLLITEITAARGLCPAIIRHQHTAL